VCCRLKSERETQDCADEIVSAAVWCTQSHDVVVCCKLGSNREAQHRADKTVSAEVCCSVSQCSVLQCVATYCNVVGAGLIQRSQVGSGLVRNYLARQFQTRLKPTWLQRLRPAPTRSLSEVTNWNPAHRASIRKNRPVHDRWETSIRWSVLGKKDHVLVRESHHYRLGLLRHLTM